MQVSCPCWESNYDISAVQLAANWLSSCYSTFKTKWNINYTRNFKGNHHVGTRQQGRIKKEQVTEQIKLNSVALVRERTIPTERPPPVGEVVPTFAGRGVSRGQRNESPRPFSNKQFIELCSCVKNKGKKQSNSITGLHIPRRYQKVEAPRFQDNWHMKVIPLQAWTVPEGKRRLRIPEFKTIGTWK